MINLGKSDIEALLPHRDVAMFLLDATINDSQVEGHACWPAGHPHLVGHFPGYPIVPGVFLVEAAAQFAGVVLASRGEHSAQSPLGVLAGIKKSLIHHPVYPEERIHYTLTIKPGFGDRIVTASGQAKNSDDKKVLTVDLTIAVVERSELAQ